MTDHIGKAEKLLSENSPYYTGDDAMRAVIAHALLAIAERLCSLPTPTDMQDLSDVLASTTKRRRTLLPGEAEILAIPEPKGYMCETCGHGTTSHRMGGCDSEKCECIVPHGRTIRKDNQIGT